MKAEGQEKRNALKHEERGQKQVERSAGRKMKRNARDKRKGRQMQVGRKAERKWKEMQKTKRKGSKKNGKKADRQGGRNA